MMKSIYQANQDRLAFIGERNDYLEKRQAFIDALRSKDEMAISIASANCTHAFNVSEKRRRRMLGER